MVEARLVVTALIFMLAMFLAGILGLRHRIGIAILALLSAAWLTVDKLFEGETLFEINRRFGLTTSDFVGLLGLAIAALLWRHSRSWPDRQPRQQPAPQLAPQPAPQPQLAPRPQPGPLRVTSPAAPVPQGTREPTHACSWTG